MLPESNMMAFKPLTSMTWRDDLITSCIQSLTCSLDAVGEADKEI